MFVATIPDQAGFQVLPKLMPILAARAPRVRLDLRPPPSDIPRALASGDLELAVGVWRERLPSLIDQPLWEETFACVVRRTAPAARGPLTLDRYLALDHLLVAPRGTPGSFVDDVLAARGLQRKIALVVPQFLIAPAVVAATDLVWTAPIGLARAFAALLPLTVREPPIPLPGFTVGMRWHVRFDLDPGLVWLRGVLAGIR